MKWHPGKWARKIKLLERAVTSVLIFSFLLSPIAAFAQEISQVQMPGQESANQGSSDAVTLPNPSEVIITSDNPPDSSTDTHTSESTAPNTGTDTDNPSAPEPGNIKDNNDGLQDELPDADPPDAKVALQAQSSSGLDPAAPVFINTNTTRSAAPNVDTPFRLIYSTEAYGARSILVPPILLNCP